MCGLAGGYSETFLSGTEQETVRVLSLLACLRGTDSGGILIGKKKKGLKSSLSYYILKEAQTLAQLAYSKSCDSILADQSVGSNKFMIAHARSATVGNVNKANAHPHQAKQKHIIGVHNGTIHNFSDPKNPDHSDSRQLFDTIEEFGLEEAVQRAGVTGAMAIVWTDFRNHTINFYHNSHRPLFFSDTHDGLFWSSEEWMLDVAGKRGDTCSLKKAYAFPTEMHMSINYYTNKIEKQTVKRKETHAIPFTQSKPDLKHATKVCDLISEEAIAREQMRRDEAAMSPKPSTPSSVSAAPSLFPSTEKKESEFEKITGHFRGYSASLPASTVARQLSYLRCTCCGSKSTVRDVIWWLNDREYLCTPCRDNPVMQQNFNVCQLVRGDHYYAH